MTAAATFLGGARDRLLPASIPFRFFGAAVLYHIAGWAALILAAPDVPRFSGGPGPVLAALHLITLGVLAMTAMGAAFQLLPVATRQPLRTLWPIRLLFWVFVVAVPLVSYGMATFDHLALAIGGAMATVSLVGFGVLLADNLRRARDMPLVAAYGWCAVFSLIVLSLLGMVLVIDFFHGMLPDHFAIARLHLIVATYGFMGMLALGFSHVLIPMFTLSPSPGPLLGRAGLLSAMTALVVAVVGAYFGDAVVLCTAAFLGLVASGIHLRLMSTVMAQRMRKRMGISFLLVRVGWVLLPASILAGALDTLDLAGTSGGTLFGFVLVFGWLLTFLVGVLQRIIPFLGSMHAARTGGKPPLVSSLTPEVPLRLHAAMHGIAIVTVGVGIAVDSGLAVRVGASAGLVGALAFAYFTGVVLLKLRGGEARG